jgi:hypothetical protein
VVADEPEGWYQDPFRLHEARYFSAGRPTRLVRDGDVQSYDEPPVAPGHAVGWTPERAGAGGPNPPGDAVPAKGRRRSRAGVLAAVAVIAIAAVVTAVVIVTKPGPKLSPAAFVIQSARHTMAARTADLTISGSVSIPGERMRISGTGQADFDTNSWTVNSTVSMPHSHSLAEKEIQSKGNLYVAMNSDGRGFSGTSGGGHEWTHVPVVQSESQSANLGGSNPASTLAVLEQHGNKVRALGSMVINGVTCTGYSVTPSSQAMIAAVKEESARLRLSSASQSIALQTIGNMRQPAITVWFDAQGLLRRMSVRLAMRQAGSSQDSSDGDVVTDLSNYGTPVRISVPPASDTTP